MTIFTPATEEEAAEIIRQAHDNRTPLTIAGNGTKAGIGRSANTENCLTSAAMSGVTLYEPSEMVVSVRAGTRLSDLEAHLAEKGQRLTFEPMLPMHLMENGSEQTMGGIVAANWSGPRRIQAGACRDSLIGVRFINGRGEIVKSGGRVMKNVTGLDFVKLLAGSWGTLGFLTEVTFKVSPIQENEATLVLAGLDDECAIAALCDAMGSPYDVTGAAHLPAGLQAGIKGAAMTLLRLEGSAFSVRYRAGALGDRLAAFGAHAVIEGQDSQHLWAKVRDGEPLSSSDDRAIWRISTAPTHGPSIVAAVSQTIDAEYFYDWSGGLIWLSVPATGDAGASIVRAAVTQLGGNATLIRAPIEVRASVPVFQPLAEPLVRLSAGLKQVFDPAGVLEPGRMMAGV